MAMSFSGLLGPCPAALRRPSAAYAARRAEAADRRLRRTASGLRSPLTTGLGARYLYRAAGDAVPNADRHRRSPARCYVAAPRSCPWSHASTRAANPTTRMEPPAADRSSRRRRPVDVLSIGELLVDLISVDPAADLGTAHSFRAHQGGSAANLAANCARLGDRTALVAAVGDDGLGRRVRRELDAAGVDIGSVAVCADHATTCVMLTRTDGVADFVVWRGADAHILADQIPDASLERATIVHTTCFALGRSPARETILDAVRRAARLGCRLSLELNYAPAVWPDRAAAVELVAALCGLGALVKASRDDVRRLFGGEADAPAAVARLHAFGSPMVCLTRGADGVLASWAGGDECADLPSVDVPVADATGAGDAFWAGFLTAWLDGLAVPRCAEAGTRLAARKLRVVGPLTEPIARDTLFAPATGGDADE